VLGLLGRGGMGEVYRATDLRLNQLVALKFLPEATARDPRLLERFHGEVRIARQVSHTFVVFLLRLVFRNTWLAAAVYLALYAGLRLTAHVPLADIVFGMVLISSGFLVMIHFGILPITLVLLLQILMSQAPLTSDLSAWYASKGLIVVALVLALAVWSFRNALGGRKVLPGGFLEH
jgi:hypothetical protein